MLTPTVNIITKLISYSVKSGVLDLIQKGLGEFKCIHFFKTGIFQFLAIYDFDSVLNLYHPYQL